MKKILFITLFFYSFIVSAQSVEVQNAKALVNSGKTDEAITAYQLLLQNTPSNLTALNDLGQLYIQTKRYKEAYELANKGLILYKWDDDLNVLKAQAAIGLEKPEEAIRLMDARIVSNPDNYMLYTIKGKALDKQEDFGAASLLYSKSIEINPGYIQNYLDIAMDMFKMGRYDQTIKNFTMALERSPENTDALIGRAFAYQQLKKFDEALADYNRVIELKNFRSYLSRGVLYFLYGQDQNAIRDFEKAIEYDPNDAEAYFCMARIQLKAKEYDAALKNIQNAELLKNDQAHFYKLYVQILLGLNRNADALVKCNKLEELDPTSPDGFVLKTVTLTNLNRLDEALKVITSGIDIYWSDRPVMFRTRASVYIRQGKKSLADADITKAKELESN